MTSAFLLMLIVLLHASSTVQPPANAHTARAYANATEDENEDEEISTTVVIKTDNKG